VVLRSIGVRGALPTATIVELAAAAEAAGLAALWLNVASGAETLERAAAAQAATRRLGIGLGVVPVDREPAPTLAAEAVRLGLDPRRVTLGIGSGGASRPLSLLRDAIAGLRDGCELPIAVGALGPRMRRLGAELADGIVYNWLTPAAARAVREDAERDAAAAGRARPRTVLYLRTIVDREAVPALAEEAARYEGFGGYRAHFERNGYRALAAALDVSDGTPVAGATAAYGEAMDEIVHRAITADDSPSAILRVLDAVAGR